MKAAKKRIAGSKGGSKMPPKMARKKMKPMSGMNKKMKGAMYGR